MELGTGIIRPYKGDDSKSQEALWLTLEPLPRDPPGPRELSDKQALDVLAEYMSNPGWPQELITDLAAVVRRTGRVVADYPDRRPHLV